MGNGRNEISALYLIQAYCLPSLLYSCETWSLSPCDDKRVDVAWNNAFRKIFNAYWHESVKPLQYYCSCLPVSILLPMKKLLLWKKMLCSGNLILCRLAKCCDSRIFALAAKYHIEPHDVVRSSVARIKDSFWFNFFRISLVCVIRLFCIFLYYCVCSVMYFIVHAAFVRIKLMMMTMMMIISRAPELMKLIFAVLYVS